MASRKSSYKGLWSGPLFARNLRRFWPLWAALCVAWFLILPGNILNESSSRAAMSPEFLRELLLNFAYPAVFLCGAGGLASSLCVWQYLCSAKAAQAWHGFPLKREGLFYTNFASGLAIALIPVAFAIAATLGACFLNGPSRTPMDAVVVLLAVMSASALFGFCLGTFCVQLTGNLVMAAALFAVFNGAAVAARSMVFTLAESLTWGLSFSGSPGPVVRWLTPLWKLSQETLISYSVIGDGGMAVIGFQGLWIYGVYSLAALGLAVLALALNHFRHTETAGDAIAVLWLRPVFRLAVSLAAAMGLTLVCLDIYGGLSAAPLAAVVLLLLVGSFAGWFASQMLLNKSFRVFGKRTFLGWGILALALVLCASALKLDLGGRQAYVPDASQVTGVTAEFSAASGDWEADPAETVALHRAILQNREILERDSGYPSLTLTYTLADGSTLRRSYSLDRNSIDRVPGLTVRLRNYMCQPEAALQRVFQGIDPSEIPTGYVNWYAQPEFYEDGTIVQDQGYLSSAQARELAAAVQADLLAGRYQDVGWFFGQGEDVSWLGDIEFRWPNMDQDLEYSPYFGVSITPDMTETLACLERLGFSLPE